MQSFGGREDELGVHRVHKWRGDEDLKENLKGRYKVELKLNLENLSDLDSEELCKKADRIFETEGLQCEVSEQDMRIYKGNGKPQDYGNFWACNFPIKVCRRSG